MGIVHLKKRHVVAVPRKGFKREATNKAAAREEGAPRALKQSGGVDVSKYGCGENRRKMRTHSIIYLRPTTN